MQDGDVAWTSRARALAALALNAGVFPGVGSIAAGARVGWAQAALGAIGLAGMLLLLAPLATRPSWALVGLALAAVLATLGAWVWGVVTGVRLVRAAAGSTPLRPG